MARLVKIYLKIIVSEKQLNVLALATINKNDLGFDNVENEISATFLK